MNGLDDIRLLKIAEMYESAYARFTCEMADRYVTDPELRDRAQRLAEAAYGRQRALADALVQLNEALPADVAARTQHAALLDVVEVQDAMRDFYRANADRPTTREVAVLFRTLAEQASREANKARELDLSLVVMRIKGSRM